MSGRSSDTIGMPASAKDTIFNSRQDIVGLLEALSCGGNLQRCAALKGGIRGLQPSQGLLLVGENLAARTDSVMNRSGSAVSNSRLDSVVATSPTSP